jgi:hypothetical protein
MSLSELERIQLTTRNFKELQGLRTACVGLVWLMMGLAQVDPSPLASEARGGIGKLTSSVAGLGVVLALFLFPRVKAYYRRTFGDVEQSSRSSRKSMAAFWVAAVLLVLAAAYVGLLPMGRLLTLLEISRLLPLVFGSAMIYHWFVLGRLPELSYRLALGSLLVGLASRSPRWLAGPDGQGVIEIVIGLSLMTAGLLDHLYLVRSMRPPATPAQAAELASNPRAEHRS